jgi:hypothetical protein
MDLTSVTRQSTWTCDNCGRQNTTGKRPSPGPASRQRCRGCEEYQEVPRDRTRLIVAGLLLVGVVVATSTIGGELVIAFWLLVLLLLGVSRMFFAVGPAP